MTDRPYTEHIRRLRPELMERFERVCQKERSGVRSMSPAEVADLVVARKGETTNYDHLGKVLAEKLRRKEQP